MEGGAQAVGFVFYPRSPRSVTAAQAGELANAAGSRVTRVGVFVDPDDALLEQVLSVATLDMLQLHGSETVERLTEIRKRFQIAVMKAIKVSMPSDLEAAGDYVESADKLMFDGKAPKTMTGAMPGGNRVSFDWHMLEGRNWSCPWMLSGGLDCENIDEAIAISGAHEVDVSSGVEDAPGHKNLNLVRAFLARVQAH
ncbi:MAG: phosphoribosylanthranilate isomerase [Proteobacteria bacterium]|nr:phosphoribosylanthranilate isomerase [Pseudomonadota bacterium]